MTTTSRNRDPHVRTSLQDPTPPARHREPPMLRNAYNRLALAILLALDRRLTRR